MAEEFANGYALIVGVDQNRNPKWVLPAVANDTTEFAKVLADAERCSYRRANVRLLAGPKATRQGILDGLRWLGKAIRADRSGSATAIVYYSGHGYRDEKQQYFLIPYNVDKASIKSSALAAEDFARAIDALKPERLLVILDCCHAGGLGVKAVKGFAGDVGHAISPDVFLPPAKAKYPKPGAKGLGTLSQGAGRAVLSSSTGTEESYVRKDGRMSIFTFHLIEALLGHAQPKSGATDVLVTDMISHVTRRVPESAKTECAAPQHPTSRFEGSSFPIALLLGGKGLRGESAPDPLDESPSQTQPSYGIQSVRVGGSVIGDVVGHKIVHGDEIRGNKILGDKVGTHRRGGRKRKA